MGFGTQLRGWDAEFCCLLAGRGRYVIRYDNRDCGLSTKLDDHPVDLGAFIAAVTSGDIDRALASSPATHPPPHPPPRAAAPPSPPRDPPRGGGPFLTDLRIDQAHVVG